MRIDDLGIGDEDEVVRLCAFRLWQKLATTTSPAGVDRLATYPLPPIPPFAIGDLAVKHPPLTPQQDDDPEADEQMRETQ